LIPRLPAFTRAHSEITLNLATRVGAVDFASAAVDASLEFGDGARAGLHQEFVLPLVLRAYAAPSWIKQNGKRISANTPRAALIDHATLPTAWQEWCKGAKFAMDMGTHGPRYDLMSMALNAAIAGLGAVLLPDFMAADAAAAGQLVALSKRSQRVSKGYYLVYPKEAANLAPLQVFKAWLLQQAA
jgi:LysR family transcriptional regulator, glycine cleavage system transcriptional activator